MDYVCTILKDIGEILHTNIFCTYYIVDYICTSKYRRQNEDKTKTTGEQELSQEPPILPSLKIYTQNDERFDKLNRFQYNFK